MLWGCMTSRGVGFMCQICGNMTSEVYINILKNNIIPTMDYFVLDRDDCIFQQDNDPKHMSRLATEWFRNNGIEVLDWPPQSPDLNPIEHLWQHLKMQLNRYETEPAGIDELWSRLRVEWDNIPPEFSVNLIESMPTRIAAVLKAKGGYTKY